MSASKNGCAAGQPLPLWELSLCFSLLALSIGSPIAVWRINRARQMAQAREVHAQTAAYVANMNLIQQAWEQNNVGRVRQLLQETAAYPDRGFEWYYWQRQTHLELKTLRGHLGRVLSVALSPDGQWIVTASDDRTAKVWEAAATALAWRESLIGVIPRLGDAAAAVRARERTDTGSPY